MGTKEKRQPYYSEDERDRQVDDIRAEGEEGEKRTVEAHEIARMQKKGACNAKMRGCKGKKPFVCN